MKMTFTKTFTYEVECPTREQGIKAFKNAIEAVYDTFEHDFTYDDGESITFSDDTKVHVEDTKDIEDKFYEYITG